MYNTTASYHHCYSENITVLLTILELLSAIQEQQFPEVTLWKLDRLQTSTQLSTQIPELLKSPAH